MSFTNIEEPDVYIGRLPEVQGDLLCIPVHDRWRSNFADTRLRWVAIEPLYEIFVDSDGIGFAHIENDGHVIVTRVYCEHTEGANLTFKEVRHAIVTADYDSYSTKDIHTKAAQFIGHAYKRRMKFLVDLYFVRIGFDEEDRAVAWDCAKGRGVPHIDEWVEVKL